MTSRVTHQK